MAFLNFDRMTGIFNGLFRDIRTDFKKTFGKDITIDDIKSIANSQFEILPEAMENKQDFKLDYVGKFYIKPARLRHMTEQNRVRMDLGNIPTVKIIANEKPISIGLKEELKNSPITYTGNLKLTDITNVTDRGDTTLREVPFT